MSKIIGFTIAKNCIREDYPIDLCILQHERLFDIHYIGVSKNDEDGTTRLITETAQRSGSNVIMIPLDWPGEGAWTSQSLDKSLQQIIVDFIANRHGPNDWVVKIDADEFYTYEDQDSLKELMFFSKDTWGSEWEIAGISTNYKQYCGSVEYYIYDPTETVFHIFRNRTGKFGGNDAMILKPDGEILDDRDINLHHVGYAKSEERITKRIHEHLVLNGNMYPGISIPKGWKFKFPTHKPGASLWPLGIGVLMGKPNETNYTYGECMMPELLYDNRMRFRHFIPEFY